jgi:hypothetical protein
MLGYALSQNEPESSPAETTRNGTSGSPSPTRSTTNGLCRLQLSQTPAGGMLAPRWDRARLVCWALLTAFSQCRERDCRLARQRSLSMRTAQRNVHSRP